LQSSERLDLRHFLKNVDVKILNQLIGCLKVSVKYKKYYSLSPVKFIFGRLMVINRGVSINPNSIGLLNDDLLRCKAAVGEIAIFLFHYYPGLDVDLIIAFGKVDSVEQMRRLVSGYFRLVKHLGRPAVDHYSRLRQILDI
jgi:hypothetical protein